MSEPATPVAEPEHDTRPKLLPPYHVIIENDDHHSQLFVVVVLRKVFGYDDTRAVRADVRRPHRRRAVVWTGPKEVAELKARADPHLPRERDDGPRPRPARLPHRTRRRDRPRRFAWR